jgi:hypothetical protein
MPLDFCIHCVLSYIEGSLSYLAYFFGKKEDKVAITGYGGNRASILPHLEKVQERMGILNLSAITSVKERVLCIS